VLIDGVVNLVTPLPPASTDPPVAAAYQSTVVPLTAFATNTTVPGPHRAPAVPVGTAGKAFTTVVIAFDVAGEPDKQAAGATVINTLIWLLLASVFVI
jgi:hypothetical protein